jgi:L-rhamnose isomerase/sugar isomerase
MNSTITDRVCEALDRFQIELPSWGFANTGTRFGKYLQPAAATTIEEKLSDAGQVHALTGACPQVAVHVLWDFPEGIKSAEAVVRIAAQHGIRIGAINPNLFQDQEYKFGSVGNPDERIRAKAREHCLESVAIARKTGSRDISLWFADGSNYPGTANIRQRKKWFEKT